MVNSIFKDSFIPKAYSINIDDNFAPWVGTVLENNEAPILIVADKGREEEVITRLARVGFDNTIGYLQGGIDAWIDAGFETDSITSISPDELKVKMTSKINIVDVRKESEFHSEHIDTDNVVNRPLDFINKNLTEYDSNEEYYIHCAGGFRSMITASVLKANGIEHVSDIQGGYNAIKENGIKVT